MFDDLIVQPLFNLLVFIYAILPGHNFGLALILFTVVIRIILWPVLKKQLTHSAALRRLQPEIKKIKAATKGDRPKEMAMLQELYKEREINPLGIFPVLILQIIVLLGLFSGLNKLIKDPNALVDFSYPFVQNLSWMQTLKENIQLFDNSLFGLMDLGRAALSSDGLYWPALILVAGSAIAQFFQSKQLMPTVENQRSLRTILKEAGSGKEADQSELNAAVGRSTMYLLPAMVFLFSVNLAAALSLYWLVGGVVAFYQQSRALKQDELAMEAIANEPTKKNVKAIPEAEVVATPTKTPKKSPKSSKRKSAKKRRK